MRKREFDAKCKKLFRKAIERGLTLHFEPNYFDHKRLNCIWYGGTIATIKVSDSLSVEIDAYGDVRATLFDSKDNELAYVKDKNNSGIFYDEMSCYIRDDGHLKRLLESGRLVLDNNNWIEYDGIVNKGGERSQFVDLGMIVDNIVDDDILTAIEQILDNINDIAEEILEVAKEHL